MRLSAWRSRAPIRDVLGPRVLAVVEPVLAGFGAEPDPHCWVAWGDDPDIRYPVLVLTPSGLIVCNVRVNVPGEGPRASAKLVRWSRVSVGELAVETQSGHRLVSFQVEGQILRGADAEADAITAFAIRLFAGIDGREMPPLVESRLRRSGSAAKARAAKAKPAATAKPAGKAKPAPAPSRKASSSSAAATPTPSGAGRSARGADRP
jgi:hypothetical protein